LYLVFNISLTSVISQYVQVIIACCWPYVQIKKGKKKKEKEGAGRRGTHGVNPRDTHGIGGTYARDGHGLQRLVLSSVHPDPHTRE